ncbi:MAG: 3-phosphoshikimate 1-carboxyvinyltransferase [Fluviicola sp.]|nr:3-phosphoshikimate 1-carboxyvinyltransferase [Fluviicola sp.]
MVQTVSPATSISGTIAIPPSKSHSQRILACALLSNKETIIHGIGQSNDELAALHILKQSNAEIETRGNSIVVKTGRKMQFSTTTINFHESGLATRMFTPILGNASQTLTLTGSGSLLKRPMHLFDQSLPAVTQSFQSTEGFLPFRIQGPLIPADMTLDGSLSSQFITGFIYAFAGSPLLRKAVITIEEPNSIPYIELSLDVLKSFGVELKMADHRIEMNGPYTWKNVEITVEGDWSSASFLLVAAALKGSITITNLNKNSHQADKKLLEALVDFGATIEWKNDQLTVSTNLRNGFQFDATHCPDLFPPLAVLASYGNSESRIKGIHRLWAKESNRALTLQQELGKLGAQIDFEDDEMVIQPLKSAVANQVSACHDHRIAMACAVFALNGTTPVEIHNAEAVNKSFPDFFTYLHQLTKNATSLAECV